MINTTKGYIFALATKSDTVAEPNGPFQGIINNSAAAQTIVVVTPYGETLTILAIPPGTFLPVQGVRIHSTGTTATNTLVAYMPAN